jgi:serine/threonine-protein kinase
VALKVVRPVVEGEELRAYEKRFLDEAAIAAKLQHPGIVVVHDVGRDETSGALFIALELLRGQTLADLARHGPVEWPLVMRIVAQVARALHHAHRNGVVHRDIKPANVILLPTGEAKVTDFGIAQLENAVARLTSTGEFIGTPLYSAPEQARIEKVDGRADVFSLASVAYTLLAGRPPFEAPTVPGIVHRVVYEEPEPLGHLVVGLPADVERVLGRAMAKEPGARYQTAEAFAEDAEDVSSGQPPRHAGGEDLVLVDGSQRAAGRSAEAPEAGYESALPPPLPRGATDTRTASPPPRAARSSRTRLVVGGAVALALVALFVWMPRQSSPSRTAAAPTPAASSPAPAAPTPAAEPSRLRVDFDHPLRRGKLRVFVDGKLAIDRSLSGQQAKKAVVFTVHEGTVREEIEVAAGLHEVRLEVVWDNNVKAEKIVGNFRSGVTRSLEASLGRLRRDLKLEWK